MAERISKLYSDVLSKLQASNASYKAAADKHCRLQTFNIGDLVMMHLNKHRLQQTPNAKLHLCKLGPFPIKAVVEDDAYIIYLPPDLLYYPTFNVVDLTPYFPPDEAPIQDLSLRSSSLQQEGNDVTMVAFLT
ncbi:hypothetical protein Sjap_020551 [Stephania japonica]|uniref:Tf2-1-like SH3-like domain-containing protein n=1 Tax=Stephania japonica TaxID=461633 RepID=A0AAP0F3N8_9MAGN